MADTFASRDGAGYGPETPPPSAFRPLPGNVQARTDDHAPDSGSTPRTSIPTAEAFAHRVVVGVVTPLFGMRLLVELPSLIGDLRNGHGVAVPLALAQTALVAAPAVASVLPGSSAFRRTAVAASIGSWPVMGAASIAAAKCARFPMLLCGYVAGITSALAAVSNSHWAAATNAVAQSWYMGVVKHKTAGERDVASLFSTTIMPAAMTVPFVFIAQAMILRAREHDRIARSTAASAVAADRLTAADAEATRFNALLHDQVLAVLKAVKMDAPATDVRKIARVALRLTERPGGGAGEAGSNGEGAEARFPRDVAPEVLDRTLRQVVLAASPDCTIRSSAQGPPVPGDAASALESALTQVARNSARHAGDGVRRTCDIGIRSDGIEVAYADDGRGFDPATVPHDRLGLRTSIRDRLHSVPGATVRVTSCPGAGTRVELEWTREPTEAIPVILADSVIRKAAPSILVGGAITLQMLLERSTTCRPAASVTGWALGMAALHLQRDTPAGKPPGRRTALIIGLASAGTLLPAVAGARPSNQTVPAWHEYTFAVALSMIGARGRPALATATSLLWLAGKTAFGRRRWDGLAASTHVPAIVLSGAVSRMALHTVNRRVRAARMAERRLLDMVDRRHAQNRVREANRMWLDDVAGAFLRRIRHLPGGEFTAADRATAGLLDARIRDSLRSPRLDRPDVSRLAWQLRARGVTVLLVDDRGERGGAPEPPGLVDEVAAAFAGIAGHIVAEDIRDGRLTVRLLPPGRANLATIVLSPDTAEPLRLSIPA